MRARSFKSLSAYIIVSVREKFMCVDGTLGSTSHGYACAMQIVLQRTSRTRIKTLVSPDGDKAEGYAAKVRTLPYTFVASHKGHNNE